MFYLVDKEGRIVCTVHTRPQAERMLNTWWHGLYAVRIVEVKS